MNTEHIVRTVSNKHGLMRRGMHLCAAIVALAAFPATGLSQQDTLRTAMCVVHAGQMSTMQAAYNPATGDTTFAGQQLSAVFPTTAQDHAATATWFINNEPVNFAGHRYVKYGLPRVLSPGDVMAAGTINGVTVFAEPGAAAGSPEVLYVPTRAVGCEFQPYQFDAKAIPAGPVLHVFQPWPPPAPSKRLLITSHIRGFRPRTFRDVAAILERAFTGGGYEGLGYYAVPGGFAAVTSFEQTRQDATPLPPPNRWIQEIPPPQIHDLSSFLQAIFSRPEGYYRIAVVTVTDQPYQTPVHSVPRSEAENWLNNGLNGLPASVAAHPFTDAYQVMVLIYEFERANPSAPMLLKLPGRWEVDHHLTKAGVWRYLVQ